MSFRPSLLASSKRIQGLLSSSLYTPTPVTLSCRSKAFSYPTSSSRLLSSSPTHYITAAASMGSEDSKSGQSNGGGGGQPGVQRPDYEQAEAKQHGVQAENLTDEWKYRAPYKIHEKGDFNALYHASCNCGTVQFQLSRKAPLDSKYCHCTTCKGLHGAPFQWAAIFHKSDINFTHGHHDLVWYDPGSKSVRHQLPCKISCAKCRAPLMDEGRNMILMYPPLIHWSEGEKGVEEKKNFEVTCHMFYNQRDLDVKDGKEKWTGINKGEGSELLPESEW